jgi:predicted naringenin-chalcone synthase
LAAAHARSASQQNKERLDTKKFLNQVTNLIQRYGCSPNHIGKRGSELIDFTHFDWDKMKIFNFNHSPQGKGMEDRMRFFDTAVDRIFEKFYPDHKEPPDDLIHITCTGYVSPSGAQKIVVRRNWNQKTTVSHAYHMGCYAAMPALRMASGFLASSISSTGKKSVQKYRVDLVHSELCTLHFNPSLHTPEQLVVQSLFADGFICYSAFSAEDPPSRETKGLKILAVREEILPESLEAMTWITSDWGMEMTLSREVPKLIGDSVLRFINLMCAQAGLDFKNEEKKAVFAVHPGGPKIIDQIQEILELEAWQLEASRRILFEYGNMSSATLPHVWQRILENTSVPSETLVVSLAFGPGLSICGNLLRKI